jgi:hypothetical protein
MPMRVWIPAVAVFAFVATATFLLLRDSTDETTLTVMSFNIYGGASTRTSPSTRPCP